MLLIYGSYVENYRFLLKCCSCDVNESFSNNESKYINKLNFVTQRETAPLICSKVIYNNNIRS